MAFNTEVSYYAGSITNKDTHIAKFLVNGVQWVISMIEKTNPDMLPLFASLQTLNDSTRTLTLNTNSKIIDIVRRNGNASEGEELKCSPINAAFRSNAKNTDSIYYASKDSPVYYIDNSVLNILPIPDNDEIVKISIVLPDSSIAANATSIDNFPSEMYHAVILYASAQLLHHKMTDINAKLPTDLDSDTTVFDAVADINTSIAVSTASLPAAFSDSNVGSVPTLNISTSHNAEYLDALASAKNLIDVGITTDEASGTSDDATTYSAGFWLKDEDEEMVQSTLTVAAQELQRASSYLSKFQADINKEVQEFTVDMQTYQAKVAEESAKSGIDTSRYQTELGLSSTQAQHELGEWNTNLQKRLTFILQSLLT